MHTPKDSPWWRLSLWKMNHLHWNVWLRQSVETTHGKKARCMEGYEDPSSPTHTHRNIKGHPFTILQWHPNPCIICEGLVHQGNAHCLSTRHHSCGWMSPPHWQWCWPASHLWRCSHFPCTDSEIMISRSIACLELFCWSRTSQTVYVFLFYTFG